MSVLAVAAIAAAAVSGLLVSLEALRIRERSRKERLIAKRMQGDARVGTEPPRRRPLPAFAEGARGRGSPRAPLPALSWRRAGRPASRGKVEGQLPELIDVVCLGIEGGMTFEASFGLYTQRFDTDLARACRPAAMLMESGVEGRETVLRRLAAELDCRSFTRFVEISLRSIRFGARLAPMLRDLADEVRESRSASSEEAIAKAPTKMLVPTGLLILPAMLLLVAGPFLLELLNQM